MYGLLWHSLEYGLYVKIVQDEVTYAGDMEDDGKSVGKHKPFKVKTSSNFRPLSFCSFGSNLPSQA